MPLHLFEAVGIELEYMIVDAESLSVRPIADALLKAVGGAYELEVALGELAWSNELALHVIELKTNGPKPSLAGLAGQFQDHVRRVNTLLVPMGARLLPTGMHPWMDPHRELALWSHENDIIYSTFDRIFNCKGHGWANLQSMHINLPFEGDAEFGQLHAAMRLLLPILPALAASSPVADGLASGFLNTRLEVYRTHAAAVPSVVGQVIPEAVFTRRDYEGKLLKTIYDDLAPHDPEGILRDEWVNARGCIARFDRMAIEIRLIDTQECPKADLAIAAAVTAVLKALVAEKGASLQSQMAWNENDLAAILRTGIRDAEESLIDNPRYLEAFGIRGKTRMKAGELWQALLERWFFLDPNYKEWEAPLRLILEQGCLSRRILRALGPKPPREKLHQVYRRLADCLEKGSLFESAG